MLTDQITVNLNPSMATHFHKIASKRLSEKYNGSGSVTIFLANKTEFPGGDDWTINGAVGESKQFQGMSPSPERVMPTYAFLDIPGVILYREQSGIVEQFTIPLCNITGVYYIISEAK